MGALTTVASSRCSAPGTCCGALSATEVIACGALPLDRAAEEPATVDVLVRTAGRLFESQVITVPVTPGAAVLTEHERFTVTRTASTPDRFCAATADPTRTATATQAHAARRICMRLRG